VRRTWIDFVPAASSSSGAIVRASYSYCGSSGLVRRPPRHPAMAARVPSTLMSRTRSESISGSGCSRMRPERPRCTARTVEPATSL
jgi:hypothetical protein